MRDYTISEFRMINEAYEAMLESQARPDGYKNLSPEQADALAKLSPSYKSPQIWGNTSNWICSVANRMIKYRKLTFDVVYEYAKSVQKYIADFERFGKSLKKDISSISTFDDLESFMEEAMENGLTQQGLSTEAKKDGRARQCYSLMKNGEDSFIITYEDGNYIIGYPTNYEYNSKFSSIGKWCHTGSFGNGEHYWGQYAQYPVFYILDKRNGIVLCASYQNGYGEVRDQLDNYPQGFNGKNWNEFFTELGIEKPMVNGVSSICSKYDAPDDAIQDVWDRVDSTLVDENLFCNNGSELEGDDYGRGTGNFYLNIGFEKIDPNSTDEDAFFTRYASETDDETYSFEEFRAICNESFKPHGEYRDYVTRLIVNSDYFMQLWNEETNMTYYSSWGNKPINDDRTMADRFSIEELIEIIKGNEVDFGFDSKRKSKDIKDCFQPLVNEFVNRFNEHKRKALPSKYGSIDMYNDKISLSIDADEANSLATRIQNGEFKFEKGPDLIALNLDGKNTFSIKKINIEKELIVGINNTICYMKHICKTPKDLEGQMTFDLKYPDGTKYYGG